MKITRRRIFLFLTFLGVIVYIYRNWFLFPQIIGGDWPYLFPEMLRDPSIYFSSWNPGQGNGLGGVSPLYSLGMYFGFTVFLAHTFNIPWVFIYKFFWFTLPLLFGILSSIYLVKSIFPKLSRWQRLFSSLIFITNTYFLMVVGGGQMGVALAYSIAPLALGSFMKLIGNLASIQLNFKFQISNFKLPVLAGLVLALQTMFDPRIAYLSMLIVGIYIIFSLLFIKFSSRKIFSFFLSLMLFGLGLPVLVAGLLHAVWILPILFLQSSPIPQSLTNVDGFRFFSFADFSHAISLLHPNWPENIFGKTYFMKAEFMLLPIIAYSSLLFLSYKSLKHAEQNAERRGILFFALLGLMGAFLAKGANEPFSSVNIWLFENIPGFAMFRDPTKFYILIALSYSALIPFSIYSICGWLNSKFKSQSSKLQFKTQNYLPIILLLFFVSYWVISIHPAILGKLRGTFKMHEVPKEYIELKDFLYNQKEYFRTLWVPRQQRFSFASNIHPSIEAEPLFGTRSAEVLSKKILSEQGQFLLSELSVKYVLIQYDSLGEQFLEDRKYSEKQRIEYERKLDAIPSLKKIRSGKIAVYETSFKKDHFFLDKAGKISAVMINPMHYVLTVSIDQPQNLIFSESYSPYWILKKFQETIFSKKTKNGLNSFRLDQKGKYTVDILFFLEKYYEYGRIISFFTIIALTICLIKLRKK